MIKLIQNVGNVVTPSDDSILYQNLACDSILSGCNFSFSDNILRISDGYIVVKGRVVKLLNFTKSITLPTTGTATYDIVLRIDLSNLTTPADIYVGTLSNYNNEEINLNGQKYDKKSYFLSLGYFGRGKSNLEQFQPPAYIFILFLWRTFLVCVAWVKNRQTDRYISMAIGQTQTPLA